MITLVQLLIVALGLGCIVTTASAQGSATVEKISFEVEGAFERGAKVLGELRIPDSDRNRLPAVVIINSSPGFDGRGAFYAEALNQAGIATLEIDMFQGRGIPASPVHNLPHAYQSLRYLAAHPRVNSGRVGIMGFSWGAQVSLLTNSASLTRQYSDGGLSFAAHLPVYPQCWVFRTARSGKDPLLKPPIFREVTGRPVHILTGDKDDYDGPDGCQLFLEWLPAHARRYFSLTVYEGATFAWDSRFSSAVYEAGAKRGQGGIVNVIANSETARQSRQLAVRFFSTSLGAE